MKNLVRFVVGSVLLAGLASCHGIGQGNTIRSLKIVFYPVSGEQGAYLTPDNSAVTVPTLKMYDCFCSTVVVYGYFDDGTIGDVTSRATLTSSDPATVEVAKFDTTQPCAFTQNDPLLWTLVPKQTTAAAGHLVTLTAQFVGLTATLDVRVDNTATALNGTLGFVSSDTTQSSPQVAVGSNIRLLLQGMLDNDGVTRTFNNNVHTDSQTVNGVTTVHTGWTLTGPAPDNADCTVPRYGSTVSDNSDLPTSCPATLSKAPLNGGVVAGIQPTGNTPANVQASFGSCGVSAPQNVQVGDISQLTLAEEDNFYPGASDHLLASNSNEILKVTGTLDFHDGGAAGTQLLSPYSTLSSSDTCMLVEHDAVADPGNTTFACTTPTAGTCTNATPVCATNLATCPATMTPCRKDTPPIQPTLLTQVIANATSVAASSPNGPTALTAQFPGGVLGTQAFVQDDPLTAGATVVNVDVLKNFPATFPWYGVIDKGTGSEEVVRVTAASGTALTVVRGGSAVQHLKGATFDQRSYTSTSLNLSAMFGTLTDLGLMDVTNTNSVSGVTLTSTSTPPITSRGKAVQLQALGTYDDGAGNSRQQNVTHLTAANSGPAMAWSSSNTRVATVGTSGIVTPNGICGGSAVIRARATTSASTTDNVFAPTITTTDTDGNFNDDANDTDCLTGDPLCDQVNVCIVTPSTLPEGTVCAATTAYDSGNQKCVITCAAPATYNNTTGTCVTP